MFGRIKHIKSILTHIKDDIFYSLSFIKNYKDEDVIFSHLRSHAHALDKGLHIVPFEKGHGKILYQRIKDLKSKIQDKKLIEDPAFLWANSVIDKYENAQKTGMFLEDEFEQTVFTDKDKTDFYKIIKSRISCRNFTNEEINDEIWDEIIGIAADAPSGCCRHTERYYIEKDRNIIKDVVPNILGATGFSEKFIPYLVCITADTRHYPIKERFMPYIDVSLSIQNFLLACTVNNIYCTLLNFQATKKEIENVKKILNIPDYERIILFAAVGKAKKTPLKPARIDVKQIRKK